MMKKGKDQAVHGPRIQDCVDRFIASRKHELGDKTVGHYKLLLGRLVTYCEKRGVHFMRELRRARCKKTCREQMMLDLSRLTTENVCTRTTMEG